MYDNIFGSNWVRDITKQREQLTSTLGVLAIHDMFKDITKQREQMVNALGGLTSSAMFREMTKQREQMSSVLGNLKNTLDTSGITASTLRSTDNLAKTFSMLETSALKKVQQAYENFDIYNVVFNNDGSLSYGGETILAEDLETTIFEQTKNLTAKEWLYEKKESISKRF